MNAATMPFARSNGLWRVARCRMAVKKASKKRPMRVAASHPISIWLNVRPKVDPGTHDGKEQHRPALRRGVYSPDQHEQREQREGEEDRAEPLLYRVVEQDRGGPEIQQDTDRGGPRAEEPSAKGIHAGGNGEESEDRLDPEVPDIRRKRSIQDDISDEHVSDRIEGVRLREGVTAPRVPKSGPQEVLGEGEIEDRIGRVDDAVRRPDRIQEKNRDHGRQEERDFRRPHECDVEGCTGHPDEEQVQGPRRPEDPGLHPPDNEDQADETQERCGEGDDVEERAAPDAGLQCLDEHAPSLKDSAASSVPQANTIRNDFIAVCETSSRIASKARRAEPRASSSIRGDWIRAETCISDARSRRDSERLDAVLARPSPG